MKDAFVEWHMARYKHIDTSPRLIAVDLQQQLLPGTIEHALHHLLEHHIDLTGLDTTTTASPAHNIEKLAHYGCVMPKEVAKSGRVST